MVYFEVPVDNMYGRLPTEKEILESELPFSQFGRMCSKLGIKIIFAFSPQAKGRVERLNGVHQDRLIKKLRLKGIKDRENANQYLLEEYFPEHNERFSIPASSNQDFHLPVPSDVMLKEIFCFEYTRSVAKDWVVRFKNRLFQLKPKSTYGPAVAKAVIQEQMDGHILILYRGERTDFTEIAPDSALGKALNWVRNNKKKLPAYRKVRIK
jgi:hypothetical protein